MSPNPPNCDSEIIREIQYWLDTPDRALPSRSLDEKACWQVLDRSVALLENSQSEQTPSGISASDPTAIDSACLETALSGSRLNPSDGATKASRRYEPGRYLGAGGFGVVIQAQDTMLGRDVAIKMIRPSLGNQPQLQSRFIREARAVASLSHPGIVQVYETGTIDGQPFIAGELVDGPNLAQFLEQKPNALSPMQAAWLVQQIALAVQYAHSRGILHRDLKPSNVLLASADKESTQGLGFVPKLTDFGLAKRFGEASELTVDVSTESVAVGTIRYMSPEQIRGKHQDVTNKSDIFSLGIVLYQLATGHMPFDGGSFFEISEKICRQAPERPRKWNAQIPRDLDAVILKCLNKEPEDRYQTAGELANDLDRLMKGFPVEATKPSIAKLIRYWARTSPRTLAAASIVLITMLAALVAINASWLRERVAHERAEKSLELTLNAINDILFPMTEKFNEGLTITRKDHEEMLLNTIAFNEAYVKVNPNDFRALHRLSITHHYCAHGYAHMGRAEDAVKHRKESIEILKRLVEVDKDPRHQSKYLFQICFGYLQLCDFYNNLEVEEHVKTRREFLTLAKDYLSRSLELDPDNFDYQEAELELNYKLSAMDRHQSPAATAILNENITKSLDLWNKKPEQPRYLKHALLAKRVFAILAFYRKDYEQADKLLAESRDLELKAYPPDTEGVWILDHRMTHNYYRSAVSYCLGDMEDFVRHAKELSKYYDQCIRDSVDKEVYTAYRLAVLYMLQKAYEHTGDIEELSRIKAQIDSIEPTLGPGQELDTAAWVQKILLTGAPPDASPY
ncbi:MAG: serine/threonine protein kinase [Pirellula sp.]|nr:serine/threonine protein kinase [Pirellula sp.]